jgi:aminomethyltransferase
MKLTPLYSQHLQLGAKMYTTGMGYEMPAYYTSVEEEARNVRERVGMLDLSLMARFDIKGKDAVQFVQRLIVNNAARLADGQALYSAMCNENGSLVDDVVVFRLEQEHLRIITSSMYRLKTLEWIKGHLGAKRVYVTDISSSLAMISVQGPKSRDLLTAITDVNLSKLSYFRFEYGSFEDIPCLIARLGFSGELGYECYVNTEDAVATWNLIAQAGKLYGVKPYGMDTLDALRWEKGFIFFGFDATEKENPYECRLWPFIDYDCGEFVGRTALLRIKDTGPNKRLMGLAMAGDRICSSGQPIMLVADVVGHTVAGFLSPTLGRNLAYGYLFTPHFTVGTKVIVKGENFSTDAVVVEMPFLDPAGSRARM